MEIRWNTLTNNQTHGKIAYIVPDKILPVKFPLKSVQALLRFAEQSTERQTFFLLLRFYLLHINRKTDHLILFICIYFILTLKLKWPLFSFVQNRSPSLISECYISLYKA